MKISLSFAFLFISSAFYFSSAANTSDLPRDTEDFECEYNASKLAYIQLIDSIESKLAVTKAYVANLKYPNASPSMDLSRREEFSDENLSYYVKVLEDCINLLPLSHFPDSGEVEKFESEILSVIFDLSEYVSYWFKEEPEMLLEFVAQNPNLSLKNLFELAKKCTLSQRDLKSKPKSQFNINAAEFVPSGQPPKPPQNHRVTKTDYPQQQPNHGTAYFYPPTHNTQQLSPYNCNYCSSDELSRFHLRNYLLVADLTKKVVWDFGDKYIPSSGIHPKFDLDDLELRKRLYFLKNVLKRAHDHFFPTDFSKQLLEETFISRLEKFCFGAEQSSDFENWYRDITGISSRISSDIALDPLENSIKRLTNRLKFLKRKILLSPLPLSEISLFFGIFQDSISKVNSFVATRGYNPKIVDIKDSLKKLLIEFDGKILSPLYRKEKLLEKPSLLTFLLESKDLKLAQFVILLLNQKDSRRYYKCIENNEVNSEYIYCSAHSLIDDLGDVKNWNYEAREIVSKFVKILEPLPDVRPKGYPSYWLSEYIRFLKNRLLKHLNLSTFL